MTPACRSARWQCHQPLLLLLLLLLAVVHL
jgi:hypothetical protein